MRGERRLHRVPAREGEYVAYKCRNNLWDIALPLRIEGRHLATIFVGQFFYEGETPDRELFRRQAEEFSDDSMALGVARVYDHVLRAGRRAS